MTPRKSVLQELTREMIMEAARNLFVKKGFQHVSMRQIAKELGYTHGAIYYHFENKAELFYALVEQHFIMLDQVLMDVMKEEISNQEKLKKILMGFIEFGLSHQSHYEIMFLIKDEEVRNFINLEPSQSYEKFAQSISLLCGKKVSLQEIYSIFLSLHGFVTHYCRTESTFEDVKEMANVHTSFLMKAIY